MSEQTPFHAAFRTSKTRCEITACRYFGIKTKWTSSFDRTCLPRRKSLASVIDRCMFLFSMARKRYETTMPVVVKLRLQPTDEQRLALMAMIRRCNEACNWIVAQAFASTCEDVKELQKLHYGTLRDQFQLPSQAALLALDKAVGAYKRDPRKL